MRNVHHVLLCVQTMCKNQNIVTVPYFYTRTNKVFERSRGFHWSNCFPVAKKQNVCVLYMNFSLFCCHASLYNMNIISGLISHGLIH
jgi:hypothetical protein